MFSLRGTCQDAHLPTGTCVFILSQQGETVDEITYYGAAENVQVPKQEVSDDNYDIFVSNVNTFRHEKAYAKADDLLSAVRRNEGLFVLRLSGAHSVMIEKEELLSVIVSIKGDPEIVFANKDEVAHITGNYHPQEELTRVFPNARVFVLTLGAEGSLLRYEGNVSSIPQAPVEHTIVDATGAGDAYMGAMLAMLSTLPDQDWTEEHVQNCAQTGAFAASLVIQSFQSRLGHPDFDKTRKFYEYLRFLKQE